MKKKILLLLFAFLVIFICTACMSAEEKEKARENIKAGTPVVEKYLADNFGGGKIISIDFIQAKKYPGPVSDFNRYASGYCKADVRIKNGTEFQVIVDTDNKICYDNLNTDDVINGAVGKIVSLTDGTMPDDIEVNVAARELLGALGGGYNGFLSRDTDTAEKLLDGDYYFNVVLKYGSSINGVDVTKLENTPYKASITVRLLQLSEFAKGGTRLDILGKSDSNLTLDESLQHLFLREQLLLKNFGISDDEDFTGFKNSRPVTYLQKKVGNLIFAWNSSDIDMHVSSVPAEKQIVTRYYSGQEFKAMCDTAAKLDYITKTESRYCKVYAFTSDKFNDTPYLVGNGNDERKDVADSMMRVSDTQYSAASFNIKGTDSITVGIYKR